MFDKKENYDIQCNDRKNKEMIDNYDNIDEECKRIRLELDATRLPETIKTIEMYQNQEISAYNLATLLVQCDRNVDFPRILFDFIVNLYEHSIAIGDDNAMNDLGALYYDGRGCEQDFTKAFYYYDMAAKRGNQQAQENLGYCYYYGRSIPIDYEKAFQYFALGAFTGHLISLYKIGDMYMNGYYVEMNPYEAFRIYEHCIQTMTVEDAQAVAGPVFLRLGSAFLLGKGTEKNARSALICFQQAELYLYDMVTHGKWMYEKSLQEAVEGQEKARKTLAIPIS